MTAVKIDPLGRHQAAADKVLASGDPHAIKNLYVELGRDWESTPAGEFDTVPVLSMAETHPVVIGQLAGVEGVILDAGCGPNPAVSMGLAAEPGRRVVALDIGWGTVNLARAIARGQGRSLVGVVGDVERLPFRDGVFDGVVCDDTIEHLPDDDRGVAELMRVAGPGRPVVLATPNRHCAEILRNRGSDRLRRVSRPVEAYFVSNSHLREYTWSEFERLVGRHGRIVHRAPVGWNRGWRSRVATFLIGWRPFHRWSQVIVLTARPRQPTGPRRVGTAGGRPRR